MAFSATTVSAGQGLGVVVATGDNAQIGQINKLVSQVGTRAGAGPWSAQTRADGLTRVWRPRAGAPSHLRRAPGPSWASLPRTLARSPPPSKHSRTHPSTPDPSPTCPTPRNSPAPDPI